MTRDEIRGLMGAYATGTLSESERKILFEAALEDQELFDELAREQSLKEALDDPGVKARLIGALQPGSKKAEKPWWLMGWVWGASVAACVVVIAGIILVRSSVKVEEVARLELPEPIAVPAPPPPAPPVVKAESAPANVPAAPPLEKNTAQVERATTPPESKTPPPAPPQAKTEAAVADRLQEVVPVPATAAAPAPPMAQGFAANGTVAGTLAVPAPQAPQAAREAAAGGGGGGRGGGRGGAARALAQDAAKAGRFAFDYSVSPENVLRVTPHANGFLSVFAVTGGSMQPLFQARAMQAEMATQVQLPADAGMAIVVFSARQQAGFFGGSIGPGDPLSGTKTDPNPSPDSMLAATIPLKR